MSITKHIPNFLTCCNLLSGCVAILLAAKGEFTYAFGFLFIAAAFDFLDGFAARLLKAYSLIGKELDSLADVVSFGVAPGMMLFYLLSLNGESSYLLNMLPYAAFIIPALSALRLAKFNVDDRQTESFIGLPVPAHALFWGSLICFILENFTAPLSPLCMGGLALLAILTSLLLVSEIPMFSLKFKSWGWKANKLRYVFILSSLILIVFLQFSGIAAAIILYIILSIFNRLTT